MYFDVQYTISTLDKEWTVFLDPNVAKKIGILVILKHMEIGNG